jgi:hypothetical protein
MTRHLTTQILFPHDESKEKPAHCIVDAFYYIDTKQGKEYKSFRSRRSFDAAAQLWAASEHPPITDAGSLGI